MSAPTHLSLSAPLTLPSGRGRYLMFAGLMIGLFLSELDATIFSTALPTVVGELDGVDSMLWVTTAYVVAATVTMPVYGSLSDRLGRRGLFVAGLAVFVVGSVIGGLAPTMSWLIAARVVQGLGGGGLLILIQAIIADLIPARQRSRYLTAVSAVFALASVLGPVLGGWLAGSVGWRWAFWLNVPLGVLAIASALTWLHTPKRAPGPVRIDIWGITTLAVAVTALVLLTSTGGTAYGWSSPPVLVLAGVALAAGTGFVVAERRAADPVLDLRLFGIRNFTVPTVAGLITAVAMFGTINYLPTYLQMVSRLTPVASGLLMLTLITGLALATVVSGQLVTRTGHYRRYPVGGAALVAVALGLLARLTSTTGLEVVGAYLFLLGLGIGCVLQILVLVVQNAVPAAQVGSATAAHNFFREIGVGLGSAVVGTAFTVRLQVLLAERLPAQEAAGLDPNALTPSLVRQLPDAVQSAIGSAYSDALTPVFGYLVPLMLLSAVALALVEPVPLATSVDPAASGGRSKVPEPRGR